MHPATIGPYKIERELGRGGMGEVFLARDTRLDRLVAIKALPAHLAQDADRLARGPIPIDESLPIAKHLADALEVAHEKGILHRHMKPANVMVASEDGRLDVGQPKPMFDGKPLAKGTGILDYDLQRERFFVAVEAEPRDDPRLILVHDWRAGAPTPAR